MAEAPIAGFTQTDLSALVEEYETLIVAAGAALDDNEAAIVGQLVRECDWTPQAAAILLSLTLDYGSFVLRNACALAIAMKVEDGREGL